MFLYFWNIPWFEGVPFHFDFYSFIFAFWGLFQFQGVLSGTLLRSGECVGISGGCASVRNALLSPESRYIPYSYCFSGCRPYFTFLSFCSVAYSI